MKPLGAFPSVVSAEFPLVFWHLIGQRERCLAHKIRVSYTQRFCFRTYGGRKLSSEKSFCQKGNWNGGLYQQRAGILLEKNICHPDGHFQDLEQHSAYVILMVKLSIIIHITLGWAKSPIWEFLKWLQQVSMRDVLPVARRSSEEFTC